MTRLSDGLHDRYGPEEDAEQVLFDAGAVILTRHMLELIRLVSEDVGYHGNWAVAVDSAAVVGTPDSRTSPATTGTAPTLTRRAPARPWPNCVKHQAR